MQVHKENGSVTTTNRAASAVRTIAQKPGPSGSAEMQKTILCHYIELLWFMVPKYFLVILGIKKGPES